jgi:hypothetical protein
MGAYRIMPAIRGITAVALEAPVEVSSSLPLYALAMTLIERRSILTS